MPTQNALSPERMTPDQRLREVAAIMALGLIRLRTADSGNAVQGSEVCLGFCSPQSVHTTRP